MCLRLLAGLTHVLVFINPFTTSDKDWSCLQRPRSFSLAVKMLIGFVFILYKLLKWAAPGLLLLNGLAYIAKTVSLFYLLLPGQRRYVALIS